MKIDEFLNAIGKINLYERQLLKSAFKEILNSSSKNVQQRYLKSLMLTGIYNNIPDSIIKNGIRKTYREAYLNLNNINKLFKQAKVNYINGKISLPKLIKYNEPKKYSNKKYPGTLVQKPVESKEVFPKLNFKRTVNVNNYYKNALGLLGITNMDPKTLTNNERTFLAQLSMNFKNGKSVTGYGRLQPKQIKGLNINVPNLNEVPRTRRVNNIEITQKMAKKPKRMNKKTPSGYYIYVLYNESIFLIPVINKYEVFGKHRNIVEYLKTNKITAAGELHITANDITFNLFSGTYMMGEFKREKLIYERYRKESVEKALSKFNKEIKFVRKSLLPSKNGSLRAYRNYVNVKKLNTL